MAGTGAVVLAVGVTGSGAAGRVQRRPVLGERQLGDGQEPGNVGPRVDDELGIGLIRPVLGVRRVQLGGLEDLLVQRLLRDQVVQLGRDDCANAVEPPADVAVVRPPWAGRGSVGALPDLLQGGGQLRAGGFATQDEMARWFTGAIALLAIPDEGPDGHGARLEILALINQDWTETTLREYRRITKQRLIPCLGTVPLAKLSAKDIWDMFDKIDEKSAEIIAARESDDPEVRKSATGKRPTGITTKRRNLAVLRSTLAEAASSAPGRPRLLSVNVAAGIKFGRQGGKRKTARSKARLWTAGREAAWRKAWRSAAKARTARAGTWRGRTRRRGPATS